MKSVRIMTMLAASVAVMLSCGSPSHENADASRYNALSYAFHYKNLDSAMHYALMAGSAARDYDHGGAEALNNKAFVYIQRMHYDSAQACLDDIAAHADNQLELAVADVQNMRLCQRRAQNKEFYDYRENARKRLLRIEDHQDELTAPMLRRLIYARTEFHIVNSVYYYYVGLKKRSDRALLRLNDYEYLHADTAQYLNYLYQRGTQGSMSGTCSTEEMQSLMLCHMLSKRKGYSYWEANTLQMFAECFATHDRPHNQYMESFFTYLNEDDMPSDLFAGYLGDKALRIFMSYGDPYQIAGTYRTLALCYGALGEHEEALYCLDKALNRDTLVNRAPDLVASIREMMSVSYSALGNKQASDYNRNVYLDLQEMTRQDRRYEARAEHLDSSLAELNIMISAVVAMIAVMVILLVILTRKRRRKYARQSYDDVFASLNKWKDDMERKEEERNARYEETSEKYEIERLKIIKNKRRAADNRAKISLAETVLPLIDRMLNEVDRSRDKDITPAERAQRLEYVSQLAERIGDYNTVLTEWIELRRGMIGLNVESFALQDVFDTVSRGSMSFALKDITLNVEPSDAVVKADKVLTLFMINTIADNARKHTAPGGRVDITAVKGDGYAEISVSDNGSGMTESQLASVFSHDISGEHGFGLVNCKGIIEKYRKTSRLFSVCSITAESGQGRGSRFSFRLPLGVMRTLASLFVLAASLCARSEALPPDTLASHFADSVYFSNVEGFHEDALNYADSVVKYINECYRREVAGGTDTIAVMAPLTGDTPEMRWLYKRLPLDFMVILDMRNEIAVAALAVRDMQLYKYNNKAYTSLFRELSSDKTLPDYCRQMQKSKQDKTVAVILLVFLLASVFPAYYFFYYRYVISRRISLEQISEINDILHDGDSPEHKLTAVHAIARSCSSELSQRYAAAAAEALEKHIATTGRQMDDMESAEDDFARAEYENDRMYVSNSIADNCLSALKHETMYYPARISQLVHKGDDDMQSLRQLVEYYRDLYNILMVQAMQQTDSMVFENRRIALSELLRADTALCTTGDRDVLAYMFEILRKRSADGKFTVRASEKDSRYVIIETPVSETRSGAALFVPSSENIPYLLCRCIVRDHSELTGLRGCGIDAVREGDVTKIVVKLTRI